MPRIVNATDVATDLDYAPAFAVVGTDSADYLVYGRSDGRIALMAGPADDTSGMFHLVGLIGDTTTQGMDYAAITIRDPSTSVSPANPLAIAWQGRNGGGGSPRQTLAFAEVTNTTVTAASAPVTFPDAFGAWGGGFTARTIGLIAIGDGAEHWLLVSQDTDVAIPTGGLVQVREIVGPGTNIRRLPVPGEVIGPQSQIGLAVSGGVIRVVETATSRAIVTRSIGCE